MEQGVLKTDDLNPDGVRIIVKWEGLKEGASMFIPCVNTEEAMRQLDRILAEKGYKSQKKVVIENKILGVRIWRTL